MADQEHVDLLTHSVEDWNLWRRQAHTREPDLSGSELLMARLMGANLIGANLRGADLSAANLRRSDLSGADLTGANLGGAELDGADLMGASLGGVDCSRATLTRATLTAVDASQPEPAILSHADLSFSHLKWARFPDADFTGAIVRSAYAEKANLSSASLAGADLSRTDLVGADLTGADVSGASLIGTDLTRAILVGADLRRSHLGGANLTQANLELADLRSSILQGTVFLFSNITNARLTGSFIHGVSVWNPSGSPADQTDLVISSGETVLTVGDLNVAHAMYLLLHNDQIPSLIDAFTSKVVLILGRFTPERKAVLDALRSDLQRHDLVPVLFDFDIPRDRDFTETVTLIARIARFVVADLTDPSSIPMELQAIAPHVAVPIRSILHKDQEPFSMFRTLRKYPWVMEPYRYGDVDELLANLEAEVIAPAEAKREALKTSAGA